MGKHTQSIDNKAINRIYGHGKGWVFTPAHFSGLGSRDAVASALRRYRQSGLGRKASGDLELFERIAAHRQVYFRYSWVDYDTLRPGRLQLVPPDEQLDDWKLDYTAMKDEMFFGEPPAFDDLIQIVQEFQDAFNRTNQGR